MRGSTALFVRVALVGALVAVALFFGGPAAAAGPFVVTTTADSNDGSCTVNVCSLRDAIAAANAAGGGTIQFDISSPVLAPSISIDSVLPAITAPVTIDGMSQPGADGTTPGVTIVPAETVLSGDLLDLAPGSDGSTINGLAFGGNAGDGGTTAIAVASNDNSISHNWIGIAADSSVLNSGNIGIDVSGNGNTIGGAAGSNVIATALSGIVVGTPDGVTMPTGNLVQGNLVGLNPDGTPAGGGEVGISAADTKGTVVGNDNQPGELSLVQQHPELGNVIAAYGTAIHIGDGSSGTIAAGNFIGVGEGDDGATAPNFNGIVVQGGSLSATNGNQIGPGNVIAHSHDDGVVIDGRFGNANGNRIVANSIFANDTDSQGNLGIDLLQGDGTTANNDIQAPVITSFSGDTVSGTYTTPTGDAAFIELFINGSCTGQFASGAGEIFSEFVNGTGGTWSATISGLKPSDGITATTTDQLTNDTSEFSNCATAGSLSGSVENTIARPVDLTAVGKSDWALWNTNTLAPSEARANGGRQISDLSIVNGDGTPTRDFTQVGDALLPYTFDWSDGAPDAGGQNVDAGITAPAAGQGLSFTVPADTSPRILTVWTSAHFVTGTFTAHLSDDSAPAYTQPIQVGAGSSPNSGDNTPETFTLKYHAASPNAHLTVTLNETADNCGGCDDVVMYAAALRGGGVASSASASLTGDTSVPMAASDVPVADIPLFAFEPQPPGSPGLQLNGLQLNGLQLNGLQLNGLQLNGLQLNGLQLNGLQLNGLQLNGLQLNGLQLNGLQLNGLQLNGLQLNGLPLDPITFPQGWQGVLAGTPLANQPLQTITLAQVLALSPQPQAFQAHPLTLGDLDLSGSALGQETLGSLALAGLQLNGLPTDYQDAIFSGLHDWCEANVPNPATACVPGGSLGDATLFALALAGAPVQGLQLNGLQLNGLQLNGLQLNGLQLNGLQLNGLSTSASAIGGMQLNGLQLNGLPLGGLQLNGLQLNGLQLNGLFDCTNPAIFDCTDLTQTIAEAQAAGAILPGTTVGDLDGAFGNLTIGDLLESILGPGSIYKDTVTFGDLIGLLIRRADVPWETLSPATLSLFDKHRPTLALTAGFTLQGSGTPDADVTLKIPDGFDYDPGSATLTENEERVPIGEPSESNDGRTLTWHLDALDPDHTYDLEFALRSGTTVGPAQVTETVTSGDQTATSVASFSVTDSFGGNNQPLKAHTITADEGVQLSTLPNPGDVDWYKVAMPPAGTRLHIHLTDLPADYDLALYSSKTTSVRTGTSAPNQQQPLQDGVLADTPIHLGGGPNGQLAPTALQDVPNDPGVPIVQVSANRGTDDEEVGMVSPGGGGFITFAVFGYNGAFSGKPYSLRVTTQAPPPTLVCPARTFPHLGDGTPGTLPTSFPSNLNTIILVDEKRLGDTYGATAEANAVAKLNHLATQDSALGVSGVVVPVEAIPGVQTLYDDWDGLNTANPSANSNPCDKDAANAIANAIADEVDAITSAHPTVQYVVFAGGDDQIPFFRIPDLTLLDNESGFAAQFGANEYHGALAAGDLLSDNPYLDTRPVPASGRQLFIPDLVGGRLVETADDIANAVTSFEGSNGILRSSSGFVSGYDFVADGSQQVADRLTALGVNVTTLANPLSATSRWGVADLFNAAFPAGGPAAINDWNGHYDNSRALMANQTDLLSTADLTNSHALNGGIFFTMGCHAGFQTTDVVVGSPGVLDWAQYFAQTHTGFVGNTGFGYGSTDSAAFSEELMTDFAGQLSGAVTLGQALTQAKDQYYLSRVAFGPYDEKTLSEAELYGLPMYGVGHAPTSVPGGTPAGPVSGTSSSTSPSASTLSTFPGSGVQSANFAATPSFSALQHGADGDYYTNAGQVQAPNYRPLQPFVSLPAARPGLVAHGVVIDSLTSEDHTSFDPDNVRPILDQSSTEREPQFGDEAWPEKVPTLVSLGSSQSLNLATGQFFTDTSGSTSTGVERLWTQINGRVTYSTSLDFTPPTVDSIQAFLSNGAVAFTGHFSDLDQTGQAGTVAFAQVVYDDDNGHWNALQLHDSGSGTWSGGVPFGGQHVQFFVEVCDAAGNCGYSSNKGRYFDAQPLPPSGGTLSLTPSSLPNAASWYTAGLEVTATSSAQTVEASVDGGDFGPVSGAIPLTTDGVHVVQARDSDGDTATGVYLVDSTPPTTPTFTGINNQLYPINNLPGPGAIGCASSDATSGLKSCVVTGYSATIGAHTLTAIATDNAGNTNTATLTYTVGFQAGDILAPVAAPSGDQTNPNASDLQVFKIKSTVPLKFQFYLDAAKTVQMTTPPAGSIAILGVAKLNSSTASTDQTDLVTGAADTGNQFRFSGGQYVYNMATSKLTAGTYYCTITLKAADGTVIGQSAKQYFVLRS